MGKAHQLYSVTLLALTILTGPTWSSSVVVCKYALEQEWDTGFLAKISIPIAERYNHGWLLYIKYDTPVIDLDVFEAELVDGHPNSKEYVFRNLAYNTIIYYYKDKVMNLYLQGNQYPSGDRSVYTTPPDAEVLFIPRLTPTESIQDALTRADDLPESERRPQKSTTSTTTTSTTTLMPVTTLTTTTTRLPWMGWKTEPVNILSKTTTTTPAPSTTKRRSGSVSKYFRHNLREVIKKSLLFYEAQRSGTLPITNRISWRSHSGLRDGSDNGVDLTGGYYTGGGYIKYGFPTASTMSILSWGAIEFKRGYVAAKELGNLLAAIKWGTDYMLKCHTEAHLLYGQVSDKNSDYAVWGRPEDMRGVRPSYKITRSRHGSDLAAETSAALAAASIVLKATNPDYSKTLKTHAISLFRFADRYRGKYDEAITDASSEYKSSGYFDELAWAAAWLYGITTEKNYLEIAVRRLSQSKEDQGSIRYLNWDDKRIAVVALLAQMTNRTEYRLQLLDFCDSMLVGSGLNYTHKGLLYISNRDTTSLACNSAFICLFAAKLGIRTELYRRFAQQQLNYILGDGERSFVVGYGKESPKRPYHRSSSCPKTPQRCSWKDRDAKGPNPQELTGALVSGPDIWDNFADDRNSLTNRVSIYNNAGFQTLSAGILELQVALETFSDPEPGELMPAILPKFDKHQDYAQVLRYSNMFYEAQRSGKIPTNSRIAWRKPSCVNDKSSGGQDLSGGFFDGGDYIKFNFPMAYTTTVLAWGMLMFPQSYVGAGEASALQSILRWSTDYFVKCHSAKYELYGQVGSSTLEHSHWLRPEDINYYRPAFKISKKFPGTELAAETAAAMAATASVFIETDPKYSELLIKHAKELYKFADQHRGFYHRSIADAAQFYPSYNGYKDELVWASIWLYLATNDTSYLSEAKAKYRQFRLNKYSPNDFYWDDKTAGINVLMARITKNKLYSAEANKFCDQMINSNQYTPKGLLYRRPWGPLQYSSGAAWICLLTADLNANPQEYRRFAKKQIHYILGDGGLGSYVVGYGPSPPKQPYHRASSCPSAPSPCNYSALYSKENNPHILYGAVIGGPDHKDQYIDERANARSNKVTIAYNAAFQSAVAGLRYFEMFPSPTLKTKTRKTRKPGNRKIKIKISTTKSTSAKITTPNITTLRPNVVLSEVTGPQSIRSTVSTPTGDVSTSSHDVYTRNSTGGSVFPRNVTALPNVTRTSATVSTTPFLLLPTQVSTNESVPPLNASDPSTTAWSTNFTQAERSKNATEEISVQNATIPNTKNAWEKTRYCGRQRGLDLFDSCAIPANEFHVHPDAKIYKCRYHAFQRCVGVQTDDCIDSVWDYWHYWNYNAKDESFFGPDDVDCKDQKTLDVENCELRGINNVFNECFAEVRSWNRTQNDEKKCRWVVFGTCVSKRLDHCKRTWHIWDAWNLMLDHDEQFSKKEMNCDSSANMLSLTVSEKFIFLVTSLVLTMRLI